MTSSKYKNQLTSQDNINNTLLPAGFYDLLFLEAKKNHQDINKILEGFFAKDFNLIKTPLLEFEENFNNDKNFSATSNLCFRSIDNISAKGLILRSDITLQIKRLLNTRLQDAILPLKLCYVGDVFRTHTDELYGDRQQTQIGCEIIGDDSDDADFIIIETTLQALLNLGLNNLTINFCLADFLIIFVNELPIDSRVKEQLIKIISQKNLSEIKILVPQHYNLIKEIILNNHDFFELVKLLEINFSSLLISKQILKIKKIHNFINDKFPKITACFTMFSDASTQYHHSLAFDIFYDNFIYPIAVGGRYKITTLNKIFQAVGSTIYMNHLRKIDIRNNSNLTK
jgi:ATP phosphoribosyltransferase regulatory subunit